MTRNHYTGEKDMGKGPPDGYNNMPRLAVGAALRSGELINPGTRELVVYCAIHKPTPSTAKAWKHGWWAADDFVWAFYDTALFTKTAVPEALGYNGSRENHRHVGMCRDVETAHRDGTLQASAMWCGCERCTAFDFRNCLMKHELGVMKTVHSKLAPNQVLPTTRTMALEEFARSIAAGQVAAVHADRRDWGIEGPYWLAQMLGLACQTTQDQMMEGSMVKAGTWLVPAKWYKCRQFSHRGYVLLSAAFNLNVNALVRLPEPVQFEPAGTRARQPAAVAEPTRRNAPRGARARAPAPAPTPAREKMFFLGEPKHNEILQSLACV